MIDLYRWRQRVGKSLLDVNHETGIPIYQLVTIDATGKCTTRELRALLLAYPELLDVIKDDGLGLQEEGEHNEADGR